MGRVNERPCGVMLIISSFKTFKMHWISTEDRLPEPGKYVLARHDRGTWVDDTDQENVNCVVVKLKFGISISQRDALPDYDQRKNRYTADDEHGNNLVPYSFHGFDSDDFSGQSITHWMPIPSIYA